MFYKGKVGRPCEYVPSGYYHPDYSVLKGNRLEYYLWWREAVEKGMPMETDEGYVWLRFTELINSDDDPLDVLRSLIAIYESLNHIEYTLRRIALELIEEYVLVKGLYDAELPDDIPAKYCDDIQFWSNYKDVTRALTRYPIETPYDDESWWIDGHYDWSSADIDGDDMFSILMMSLEGIDEYCRSSMGMGFVRATGDVWHVSVVDPFKNLMKFKTTECIRIPWIEISRGKLHDLVDSILKQATSLIRTDMRRGPPIPKSFPKEYRRIVAAAADAVIYGDPFDPKSFRVGEQGFWEDDDLEADLSENRDAAFIRGSNLIRKVSHEFSMDDFESHWADSSDVPVRYVPSYQLHPVPDTMTAEQLAFYVYWRTMARRGTFLDTDQGYVWLFCSEIINHDDDPAAVQSLLNRMYHVYDCTGSFSEDLGITACDHALLHGFDTRALREDLLDPLIYLKIASDPVGVMTPICASYLACWDFRDYISCERNLLAEALTAAYRAMDDYRRNTSKNRLADYYGKGRLAKVDVSLYEDLWCPEDTSVTLGYRRTLPSALQAIGDGIARTVIRIMNKRLGGKMPRASEGFPDEYVAVVESAVNKVLDDRESRNMRRKAIDQASSIVIDDAAVRSAAADLLAVTGMMAVADEDECSVEAPAPERPSTGWDAFFASLDDVERRYLEKGKPALKGTGRRPVEVEASVNGKAMDCIGDTVMNDGAVLSEYSEDVRRLFE